FAEPAAVAVVRPAPHQSIDWTNSAIGARVKQHIAYLRERQAERRPLIEATGATVTAVFTRLANAFQVRAPRRAIERLRAVEGVARVEIVPTFQRQLLSAVPVTRAPELWSSPFGLQGQGIRIGIVDSGIDYFHADFGGSGDPKDHENNDSAIIEPGSFPTARVVGGYDFVGDDYNPEKDETSEPQPDPDPLDCASGGHGTHVAGIAAGGGVTKDGKPFTGPYQLSLDPASFEVGPGVAPRADLYALRVFGCGGATQFLAAALEHAVDPNEDDDLSDRLDVVNASLGSSYGLQSQTNAELVRNLTAAGSLFVAAAGNEGATFYVTGSPGNYPESLSVAASVDRAFLALSVDAPEAAIGEIAAVEGHFTTPLSSDEPVSGTLVGAQPAEACSTIENAAALKGNIALIDRGSCSFLSKFERAVAAGAKAAVLVDDEFNAFPFEMGGGSPGDVPIPGVMIRRVDGEGLAKDLPQGVEITIDAGKRYAGPSAELFASYSSRGPSAVGNMLKPEITGPGSGILSAAVAKGHEASNKQGTSMATPVVAGAVALLRQAEPTLTPEQLKARMMNTAFRLSDEEEVPFPVSRQGAGRLDVAEAVAEPVMAYAEATDGRVAVSFGSLVIDEPTTREAKVIVDNRGEVERAFAVSVSQQFALPGVRFEVEPATLAVAAGATATVTVKLIVDPAELGKPDPDPHTPIYQYDLPRHYLSEAAGYLRFEGSDGLGSLALPVHGVVRAAAQRRAGQVIACAGEPYLTVPIVGSSAHPGPVVTALQLVEVHEENPDVAENPALAMRDVRAYGVGSNRSTADSFDDLTLYFGISVAGEWTTPARGQLSTIGVLLDVDDDDDADHMIVAEALNKKTKYADVLASSTYRLETGERLDTRRYLNVVPANKHDTAPFNNNVAVLSVLAHELGLDERTESLRFLVFASVAGEGTEYTEWQTLDMTTSRLDTAKLAPEMGKPVYGGHAPVRVAVDQTAVDGETPTELPQLLLFHHNNVAGQRWELVDLSTPQTEALKASVNLPQRVDPGQRFVSEINVSNVGESLARGIAVKGEVDGAKLDVITTAGLKCEAGSTLDCRIEEIPAGSTFTIRFQLIAGDDDAEDAPSMEVSFRSDVGCQHVATGAANWRLADDGGQRLDTSGGCACSLEPSARPPIVYPFLLLLVGAWWRRRVRDPS
ncbi:MAG: S8 family serine peptidase, partial [Polyangiaceae bacterium]